MLGYIYTWTNLNNGKQYVGKTYKPQDRYLHHTSLMKTSNYAIHRAFRKHGLDRFKFEVIFTIFDYDADSSEIEKHFIRDLGTLGGGYNLTEGGEGVVGVVFTDEWRANISKSKSGRNNPNYGIPKSKETISKISLAQKGDNSKRKGINLSETTKQKMSQSKLGVPKSKETKANMKEAQGTKICIDRIVYSSMQDIYSTLKISRGSLYKMIASGDAKVIDWGLHGGENNHWYGKPRNPDAIRKTQETQSKPLIIDGVVYESFNYTCRTLDVSIRQLYSMLKTGKAHYINKLTGEPIIKEPK